MIDEVFPTPSTEYDELYASFRALKIRTRHTKMTTKIKMLLDMFEDCDERDDKEKCLHDIRYFLDKLEKDI